MLSNFIDKEATDRETSVICLTSRYEVGFLSPCGHISFSYRNVSSTRAGTEYVFLTQIPQYNSYCGKLSTNIS